MNANTQKLPSLRRNVSWTFIGNVVYAACQWGVLVVLARLGSTSIVGQFALAVAVTGPVIMLANLQLRWVQATDSRREYRFRDCLMLRLVCLAIGVIAIAVIVRMLGYDGHTTQIILAVAAAKTVEAICDVIYGWYQQNERMELIAWSLMIRGPLSVIAVVIGYSGFGGLLGACVALALIWLAVLVLHDVPQAMRFGMHLGLDEEESDSNTSEPTKGYKLGGMWNPDQLRLIFIRALPVGITAGVVALLVNIPRYAVEEHFGSEELGVFAAMAYVLLAAETFVRAVNQSAMPRLSFYLRESNVTGFRDVLKKLVVLGSACGVVATVGAWLAGPFFLRHVYGAEYAASPHVLTLMVAGAALSFALRPAEVGLRSMRRFNALLALNMISLPLLFALTWWAVPLYGLWGAAVAMLVQVVVHGVATLVTFAFLAPQSEKASTAQQLEPLSPHAEPLRGPHFAKKTKQTATSPTTP